LINKKFKVFNEMMEIFKGTSIKLNENVIVFESKKLKHSP